MQSNLVSQCLYTNKKNQQPNSSTLPHPSISLLLVSFLPNPPTHPPSYFFPPLGGGLAYVILAPPPPPPPPRGGGGGGGGRPPCMI